MVRARRPSDQTLRLLAALVHQPRQWRHGYELSEQTGLKSGTLYPILMRLGDRGLLDAKWQPPQQPGRPPRHLYRLTGAGAAWAREQLASDAGAALPARAGA
ncbi:MAG TPA: PadR family transcriptional regulator [Steroidobacteraceae bacterium]|nr:PadR family transcriptional regulator [Steroidobacteraceae bacterium]